MSTHKIVETDNFGGDYPDEKELNLPPLTEEAANEIAKVLNKHCSGATAPRYWMARPRNYMLQPGFEP